MTTTISVTHEGITATRSAEKESVGIFISDWIWTVRDKDGNIIHRQGGYKYEPMSDFFDNAKKKM